MSCKRLANRDAIRASDAASKARARASFTPAEREAQRAYDRAWAAKHKDRVRAKNRRQYLADPEKYAKQRDAWRAANADRWLDQVRDAQGRRRARKLGVDSKRVTARDWARLLRRADGCCAYCGKRAPLTMDHVVPLARGGRHAIGNVTPACERCNKSKGALLLMEWRLRGAVEAFGTRRVPIPRVAGDRLAVGEPGAA